MPTPVLAQHSTKWSKHSCSEIARKQVPGHWDEQIPSRVERLEWILQLLQNQRNMCTSKFRAAQPDNHLADNDMRRIMNDWRNNPEIWMCPENLCRLNKMTGSSRHDFVKSRFCAMKLSLLGNEPLGDHLIRFNLCGDAQPAVIHNVCQSWAAYTSTDQYKHDKISFREEGAMPCAKS